MRRLGRSGIVVANQESQPRQLQQHQQNNHNQADKCQQQQCSNSRHISLLNHHAPLNPNQNIRPGARNAPSRLPKLSAES